MFYYDEKAGCRKDQDVDINLSHFTSAFLLIILSTLVAVMFGFVFPLLVLADMAPHFVNPKFVTIGLLFALFPLFGYFLSELVHYRILRAQLLHDTKEWRIEAWMAAATVLAGAVVSWFLAVR